MVNTKQLCKFLAQAKKATYASGNETIKISEPDGSTTLIFQGGDLKYHDNYFGGEPFGGREVVSLNNQPIYIMTYYGTVNQNFTDLKRIYHFLQQALSLIPEESPFRGPRNLVDGNLTYKNEFTGDVEKFSGQEKIYLNNNVVYQAEYAGGLIDQRK